MWVCVCVDVGVCVVGACVCVCVWVCGCTLFVPTVLQTILVLWMVPREDWNTSSSSAEHKDVVGCIISCHCECVGGGGGCGVGWEWGW